MDASAPLPSPKLAMAIELIRRGIPVFPCNPDRTSERYKAPLTKMGFKDATTDENQVTSWWSSHHPNALIGVPTGATSGLFVLDIDTKDGKDGFASLAERGLAVPVTFSY